MSMNILLEEVGEIANAGITDEDIESSPFLDYRFHQIDAGFRFWYIFWDVDEVDPMLEHSELSFSSAWSALTLILSSCDFGRPPERMLCPIETSCLAYAITLWHVELNQ